MLCFLLREWSNLEGPFKSKSDSVYNTFSDKRQRKSFICQNDRLRYKNCNVGIVL